MTTADDHFKLRSGLSAPGGEPARYRKKPIEITALQWTGGNQAGLRRFTGYMPGADLLERHYAIRFSGEGDGTGDGTGEVYDYLHDVWVPFKLGDWIIRGVQREFYPCVADVFAATYEPADGQRPGDQALPEANDGPSMHDLVITDLESCRPDLPEVQAVKALLLERKKLGLERYHSLLQAHNGRDWLRDLREELADGLVYAMQGLEESGDDAPLSLSEAYENVLSALFWAVKIPEARRG